MGPARMWPTSLPGCSVRRYPVSVKEHSFCASLGRAILQQKLLSSLRGGASEANIPMSVLLRRSVFSQTPVFRGLIFLGLP